MKVCELCNLEKENFNRQKNLCIECYKIYKKCNTCNIIKLHTDFDFYKKSKGERQSKCRDCKRKHDKKFIICEKCKLPKQLFNKRKNLCIECYKTHKKCNACNIIKLHKEYYQYGSKNTLHEYCKECIKQNYEDNKEKFAEKSKKYRDLNKDKLKNNRIKNKNKKRLNDNRRYSSDIKFRFMKRFSTDVATMFKSQGLSKNGISCRDKLPSGSPEDYIEHIESQFTSEMTWKNYGKEWQIDHIIPQSLIKYSSYDELNFKICWDISNLRPLLKEENLRKGNKLILEAKILLQKLTEKYSK